MLNHYTYLDAGAGLEPKRTPKQWRGGGFDSFAWGFGAHNLQLKANQGWVTTNYQATSLEKRFELVSSLLFLRV